MPSRPAGRASSIALIAAIACRPAAPGDPAPDPHTAADAAARSAVRNEQTLGAQPALGNSLGIPPFDVRASDTALAALGYGLADLLITDLARSAQLQVVDRIRLDAVLREIELVEAGRVDPATAPRVGRLVQARRLVLGALQDQPGGELTVRASIADVATSDVRTAVSARAPLDDILLAEKELAFRLLDALQVTLTPAERSAIEQLPTRSIAALLAYSRGVRFEAEANYQAAAREYEEALRLDPGFGPAASNLESVQQAAPAGATRLAGTGAARAERAAGVVGDRLNWVSSSPLGSQMIATPIEGGGDLELPTTVTITVEVPQ